MFDDYQVDENYLRNNFKEGEWDCTIVHAEEKISKNNNEMLVLSFYIEDQGTLYYYIVDDRSSEEAWVRRNQNLTRFFDCFGIQRGNFNYRSWINTKGRIRIGKRKADESGQQKGFEVKALIVGEKQPQQPQNGYGYSQKPPIPGQQNAYSQTNKAAYHQQNPSYETDYSDLPDFDTIPF